MWKKARERDFREIKGGAKRIFVESFAWKMRFKIFFIKTADYLDNMNNGNDRGQRAII